MVVRVAVIGNEDLNLDSAADNFGNDNDIIVVSAPGGLIGLSFISTNAGDDVVVLNDADGYAATLGSGNDRLMGGAGFGNYSGGIGNDAIFAGGGEDLVFADRGNDVEDGGDGIDTIDYSVIDFQSPGVFVNNAAAVILDLANAGTQNLGVYGLDQVINFENATGGNGNDRFFGTDGVNLLRGGSGNDSLTGRGGDDQIFAGEGRDTVIGGVGADVIDVSERRTARDFIVYESGLESAPDGPPRDIIIGFNRGNLATDDRIRLSGIDADIQTAGDQAFKIVAGFTGAAGEVALITVGADTLIEVNIFGDLAPEMSMLVVGVVGLAAVDFIL